MVVPSGESEGPGQTLTIQPGGAPAVRQRDPEKRGWIERRFETDPVQRVKDRYDYQYRYNPSRWIGGYGYARRCTSRSARPRTAVQNGPMRID
ncbi:MAG: hypothetical protein HY319_26510 [Armatimonadetes bacterium]|nr:hypothetical protein [Armatimonadota bacterium]